MVKAGHGAWSKSIKAASYETATATRINLSSVQQNTGKGTIKMSQIAKPWESSMVACQFHNRLKAQIFTSN